MYHQQGTTLTVCIPYRIVQLDDFISNHQLQQQLTSLSVLPKWKTTTTKAVPSKTKASSSTSDRDDDGSATGDECTPEKQQVIDYLRNTLPKQSRSFISYALATALIEVVENDPNQKHKTSKKRRKGDQDKNDDSHANHVDTTKQEPTTGPCSGFVDSKDNPKEEEPEGQEQRRDPCSSWFLSDEEQDWLTEAWTIVQSRISWQSWLQLYHRIRKTLVLWSPSLSGGGGDGLQLLQHPDTLLLWYAQRILPTLTHEELLQAQVVLQKPLDLLATTPTSRTKNEGNHDNADDPSPSSSSTTTTPQARRGHALLFWNLYQTIHQKCSPPVYAILLESPHHDDEDDVNQPTTTTTTSGCVCAEHETCLSNALWEYNHTKERMELVALYDLDQDEKWHVSYSGAPSSENWQQRQTSLKERYGPRFVCHCVRCKLDEQQQQQQGNSSTILPPPDTLVRNVVRLGHVAMVNQQYNRALLLYRHALERDPSQLSVWHAIGAVLLAQRKFLQAQRHWNQAVLASAGTTATTTSDPDAAAAVATTLADYQKTRGVAVQLEKLQAYRYLHPIHLKTAADGSSSSQQQHIPRTMSHCGGRCFVTRDPIVSEQTCRMILEWVATADDCWTTSRHYAVPTHDVPVHRIPQLLNWFLDWFHHTVHPLLEQQFLVGNNNKKKKSGRFYVHDAFVVRYQAQGGGGNATTTTTCPYLPIHVDESTHSFVLTLNDHENFQGGGTYFCDWDCLVSPTAPGVLVSFRGDSLRHGGNPVTWGERYILAGFLYYDDDDGNDIDNSVIFSRNEKQNKKKRLFPSCNNTHDEKRSSPKRFSFNFSV